MYLFIALVSQLTFAQAPNISYATPQTYNVGVPITPLVPINTGGAVPATVYGKVTTIAGSGVQGSTNGLGTTASFKNPYGIGLDASSNIYVSEQLNNNIRKITPTGTVSTLAGDDIAGYIDGTGTAASFSNLMGLTVDASNNIYVADSNNHRIRKITTSGLVSTYSGTGVQGTTNGDASVATFNGPNGMAVDTGGNVYVSDNGVHLIRKITPSGVVSTLAGSSTAGSTDGTGTAASFSSPYGLAVDPSGNVFVAELGNAKIRKITPAGVVTTFAGNGNFISSDGYGTNASFYDPLSLAFDLAGNLYVTEPFKIRRITPSGIVSTFVGSGTQGSYDGVGDTASFFYPFGIAFDGLGNLYVADQANQKIRKVSTTGYSISPTLPAGLTFDPTTGIISQPLKTTYLIHC